MSNSRPRRGGRSWWIFWTPSFSPTQGSSVSIPCHYHNMRLFSQRDRFSTLTATWAGSGPSSPSTGSTSGDGNGTAPAPNSNGGGVPTRISNPAFALNGTAIASLTYSAASDGNPTQQNYVVFYQHSNGDIRKLVYNESAWHPSAFVISGARIGTGLSAFFLGPGPLIYLYYVDKTGYLQELRGQHASDVWVNGTLGAASIQVSSSSAALSSGYAGPCTDRGALAWIFYESTDGVREARWSGDDDTWVKKDNITFPQLTSGAGLALMVDGGAWRLYGITTRLEIQEYVCSQCCQNASNTWQPGTFFAFHCYCNVWSKLIFPRPDSNGGSKLHFKPWREWSWRPAVPILSRLNLKRA